MNNLKLDKKTLDEIGRRLIASSALPPAEIDKIVANPQLFSRVTKRIAAAGETQPTNASLPFLARRTRAFAGAAILAIAATAAAGLFFMPQAPPERAGQIQIPDTLPEDARPVSPPRREVTELSPGRATNREAAFEKVAVRTTVKKGPARPPVPAHEPEGDFYAISTTYAMDETAGGGRIIRVDVPRSSLFAMGINIPLENGGTETVKADLLVGSDGVTRAIRVVK